jgi:asparagine synthase (glutamine-hydrolysing)
MSIIFGIREAPAKPVTDTDLRAISSRTDHMAPDGTFLVTEGNIGMGFQPFYTHDRSRLEVQPKTDKCGNILLWDGRLDNYQELTDVLGLPEETIPDSEIVLAAWRCWRENCFSKFVGEWSLVLLSHADRTLYLVRDHAGTRTLYYQTCAERASWSSALESLTDPATDRKLSDEFAARYLCSVPIGTFTPYDSIHAVPPGHFVRVSGRSVESHRYWDAHRASPLSYSKDAEYEEHFVALFRQAVKRRTETGAPMLAELSGGMDSTAIVCISDELRRTGGNGHEKFVNTISYFDSREPNWDERPFVSIVESRRGKSGIHIDLSLVDATFSADIGRNSMPWLWPDDCQTISIESADADSYRVVLSGLGGDELLGGIPTPLPELADLLYRHRYRQLLARSLAWCIVDRRPVVLRLCDVIAFRNSVYRNEPVELSMIPQWISERSRQALGLTPGEKLEGYRLRELWPSAASFQRAWRLLLETLPTHARSEHQNKEYRLPYLDRDLVDFLARTPREQLVRPGRRRSLMRRALKQIMPVEILERKRKAFVIRGTVLAIRNHHVEIRRLFERSAAAERGYIDRMRILQALDEFQTTTNISSQRSLRKAINLERWLQSLEGAK